MTKFKMVTFGLLLTSHLAYPTTAFSANGTVVLRDKDLGECILQVPEPGMSKTYNFVNSPIHCNDWNDKARKIELKDVPSATRILVAGNRNCWDDDAEMWLLLRTTKKQTTTPHMEIENLASYEKGQMVEPGVQMVDLNRKEVNRDQISCVRITTSAAPPSPSVTKP